MKSRLVLMNLNYHNEAFLCLSKAAFTKKIYNIHVYQLQYIHPRNQFWPLETLHRQEKIQIRVNTSVEIHLKIESIKNIADEDSKCISKVS